MVGHLTETSYKIRPKWPKAETTRAEMTQLVRWCRFILKAIVSNVKTSELEFFAGVTSEWQSFTRTREKGSSVVPSPHKNSNCSNQVFCPFTKIVTKRFATTLTNVSWRHVSLPEDAKRNLPQKFDWQRLRHRSCVLRVLRCSLWRILLVLRIAPLFLIGSLSNLQIFVCVEA